MEAVALAWVVLVLAGMIAVLQLLLAAGLPLGEFAWGGRHRVLPPRLRLASLASIPVLALAAWVALARADMMPPGSDPIAIRLAVWAFAGFFALNTLANLMSESQTERYGMTPPALVLVLCFVALGLVA
jgi:hypothetical protein